MSGPSDRAWIRQPPGSARVDKTHPLSRGLLFAANLSSSVDGVSNARPLAQTSVPGSGVDGLGQQFGSARVAIYPFNRAAITDKVTYLMLYDAPVQAAPDAFLFGDTDNSTAYNAGLYTNGSNFFFFIKNTSGAGVAAGSSRAWAMPTRVVHAGTYDGATVKVFLDGKLDGSTAQTGNIDTGAFFLQFNNWNGGGSAPVYTAYCAFVWNRALTDKEIAQISANPWQLFAKRSNPIFVSLFSGAGLTVTATIGNANAVGNTAGVSLGRTIAAALGNANAVGLAASISSGLTVNSTIGVANGAGNLASVSLARSIAATLGVANAVGNVAGISLGRTITGTVGNANAVGLTAGISLGGTVSATLGVANGVGLAATISQGVTIAGTLGYANAVGLSAGVSLGRTVSCALGYANAEGKAATISTGGATITLRAGSWIRYKAYDWPAPTSLTVNATVGAASGEGKASTITNPNGFLLIMNFEDGNGATSMADTSPYARTLTGNANLKVSTGCPGGAMFGTGALRITQADSGGMVINSAEFGCSSSQPYSVAFRFYQAQNENLGASPIMVRWENSAGNMDQITSHGDNSLHYMNYGNSTSGILHFANMGSAGVWRSLEMNYDGTTEYIFLDGALWYSTANTRNFSTSGILRIGGNVGTPGAADNTDIYIDNLVVIQGFCLHTSAFTPRTDPYG